MKFVFICPEKQKVFESDKFEIIDNHGVTTDTAGNKTLDAKVRLSFPCPFCGERHIFHANELTCPFDSNQKLSGMQK